MFYYLLAEKKKGKTNRKKLSLKIYANDLHTKKTSTDKIKDNGGKTVKFVERK